VAYVLDYPVHSVRPSAACQGKKLIAINRVIQQTVQTY